MTCPNPKSLAQHIIEHEILGVSGDTGGGGDLTINQGYPVFTDILRSSKTLSIARNTLVASRAGRSKNVYLDHNPSLLKTGMRMPRNGTITVVSVENSRNSTFVLEVRRNKVATALYSLNVTTALGNHDKLVNVDFTEGDLIEFFVNGTAYDPLVIIEVAWRF